MEAKRGDNSGRALGTPGTDSLIKQIETTSSKKFMELLATSFSQILEQNFCVAGDIYRGQLWWHWQFKDLQLALQAGEVYCLMQVGFALGQSLINKEA